MTKKPTITPNTLSFKEWHLVPRYRGDVTETVFNGAVNALGVAYGIAPSSIGYLLNNGWKQSLADSYAGPRAKAIKEGDDDDSIAALIESCVAKRIKSIREGMVASSGGRDPIISVAKDLLAKKAESLGKALPKGDDLDKLLEKWVPAHMDEIKAEIAKRRLSKIDTVSIDEMM